MSPLSNSPSPSQQLRLTQHPNWHSLADMAALAFSHQCLRIGENQLCATDCELLNAWGAVVRQIRKRTGEDDVSGLTEHMLVDSYLNERSRVIRGWPRTGEIPETHTFFRHVDQLLEFLYDSGCIRVIPQPGYWYTGVSVLDPSYSPLVVTSCSGDLLYASGAVQNLVGPETIYRGASLDLRGEFGRHRIHDTLAPVLDDDRGLVGIGHTLSAAEPADKRIVSLASWLKSPTRPTLVRLVPIAFVSAVVLMHFLGGVAHSCLEL